MNHVIIAYYDHILKPLLKGSNTTMNELNLDYISQRPLTILGDALSAGSLLCIDIRLLPKDGVRDTIEDHRNRNSKKCTINRS